MIDNVLSYIYMEFVVWVLEFRKENFRMKLQIELGKVTIFDNYIHI